MKFHRALALILAAALPAVAAANEYFVYFGTYSKAPSKGIYRARFDTATGKLSAAELAIEAKDPSFVALHPNGKVLYAVDESLDSKKNPGANGIAAYSIDAKTGALKLISQQSFEGSGPCHVSVDRDGRCVFIANYNTGSIAAMPLDQDGRISPVSSFVQHTGSGANPGRQASPHAHSIYTTPDNRFVLAADLGADKVFIYRFEAATGKLTANDPASGVLAPGSGPRHLVFSPNGKFVYVINEMLCTVTKFSYDAATGALAPLETISTLPPGETKPANGSCAEIAIHPNGKFLYASTRGHNSITVYSLDAATGKLTFVDNKPSGGKTPRHFALDPTGAWLIAEHQDSSDVMVFRVDGATGKLTPTGAPVSVPSVVGSVFVPAPTP